MKNHTARISIALPATLIVWIALICLSIPGFAVAAEAEQKCPVDDVTAIEPGSDGQRAPGRESPVGA